jgi:hypothetical protein
VKIIGVYGLRHAQSERGVRFKMGSTDCLTAAPATFMRFFNIISLFLSHFIECFPLMLFPIPSARRSK